MASFNKQTALSHEDGLDDDLLDRAVGGAGAPVAVKSPLNEIQHDISMAVSALAPAHVETHAPTPVAVVVAPVDVGVASIAEGHCEFRVDADRLIVVGDGAVVVTVFVIGRASIVEGHG